MKTNSDIIDEILRREGGFVNDPLDRGGPTNFGITQADLSKYLGHEATVDEVRDISVGTARDIYSRWYLSDIGLDTIPDWDMRHLMVDSAVNHGPKTAIKWLQMAINAYPLDGIIGDITKTSYPTTIEGWRKVYFEVLSHRFKYYISIVMSKLDQLRFLRGWINRCTEFLQRSEDGQ